MLDKGMELKLYLTEISMKDGIKMVKNKAKGFIFGKTEINMREIGRVIREMVMDYKFGKMVAYIVEIGKIIYSMEKASTDGLIEIVIKVNSKITRKTVRENIFGQTDRSMKGNGSTTNKVELVNFSIRMEILILDILKMEKRTAEAYFQQQKENLKKDNTKMENAFNDNSHSTQ